MAILKPGAFPFRSGNRATPLPSVSTEYTFWLLWLIRFTFTPGRGWADRMELQNTTTSSGVSFTMNPRSEIDTSCVAERYCSLAEVTLTR
jgi:hypothetical protein